jgi:hypothetical protein
MTNTKEYSPHPAALIFPMMGDTDLQELAEDIKANGLHDPIVLLDEMVLDGRNRLAACKLAGCEPSFVSATVDSPVHYVISKNLHRRHLTASQRAAIGAEMMPMLREEARQRQVQGGGDRKSKEAKSLVEVLPQPIGPNESNRITGKTRDIAGLTVGVSGRTVNLAARVKERNPEEFEKIKLGEVTVGAAYRNAVGHSVQPTDAAKGTTVLKTKGQTSTATVRKVANYRPPQPHRRINIACLENEIDNLLHGLSPREAAAMKEFKMERTIRGFVYKVVVRVSPYSSRSAVTPPPMSDSIEHPGAA